MNLQTKILAYEKVKSAAYNAAEAVRVSVDLDTETGQRKNLDAWETFNATTDDAKSEVTDYIQENILDVLRYADNTTEILDELREHPELYFPLIIVSEEVFDGEARWKEKDLSPEIFKAGKLGARLLLDIEPVYIYRTMTPSGTPKWVAGEDLTRTTPWAESISGSGYSKID